MADKSGFPDCTKWKNYRYPLTRLTEDTHYTVVDATGSFTAAALDIWVSDDWFLHADALGINYKIVMENDAGGDKVVTLQYPTVFQDGTAGTTTNTKAPWFQLAILDSSTKLDVAGLNLYPSYTENSWGHKNSLYTIIPGLHFQFRTNNRRLYGDDDEFKWKMKKEALDGLPKIMDDTYTCWHKSPESEGDTVVTEPFPAGLGNKNITISYNSNRHVHKVSAAAAAWGNTMYMQGSVDKVNWFNIATLVDDYAHTYPYSAHWNSNAVDGHDFPYKRLKLEFITGGTPVTIQENQWMQLSITPS